MKTAEIIKYKRRHEISDGNGNFPAPARFICFVLLILGVFFSAWLGYRYNQAIQKLPSIADFSQRVNQKREATVFYDRSGEKELLKLVYPDLNSSSLPFCGPGDSGTSCLSADFSRIITAAIDPQFQQHPGISFFHLNDPQPRTIAEKLIRSVYGDLSDDESVNMIRTRVLALEITHRFGRNQVLNWYLNTAWYGRMAFGANAAAQVYLNKSAAELNVPEIILLSVYLEDPEISHESPDALRSAYLGQVIRLRKNRVITDAQVEEAGNTHFVLFDAPEPQYAEGKNPILQEALSAAFEEYGEDEIQKGGYRITTSLNSGLQDQLECLTGIRQPEAGKECRLDESDLFTKGQRESAARLLQTNSVSAVIMDAGTGQLLAAVEASGDAAGGGRVSESEFKAYDPGSSLTPFAALYAYSRGYAPSSLVWDLPDSGALLPAKYQNSDGKSHGPIRLRTALTADYLAPISELIQKLGTAPVWNQAASFGLKNLNGSSSAGVIFNGAANSAEDLAFALMPFASAGNQYGTEQKGELIPVSILSVQSAFKEGKAAASFQKPAWKPLIDAGLAYLTAHTFSQETESFKYLKRPAAVKIGRVSGSADFWMNGFTPQMIACVHVQAGETNSAEETEIGAVSLWQTLMNAAHENLKPADWPRPDDVRQIRVCVPSGKLPGKYCPETASEVFIRGSEPEETDDLFVPAQINKSSMLLATRFTPPGDVTEKIFMSFPKEAKAWAESEKIEMIPEEYDPIHSNPDGAVNIFEPALFSTYSAETGSPNIAIKVRINSSEAVSSYQVSIGSGLYPEQWTERCSGKELKNGNWRLCVLEPAALKEGLNDIRVSIVTINQKYQSADTYITLK